MSKVSELKFALPSLLRELVNGKIKVTLRKVNYVRLALPFHLIGGKWITFQPPFEAGLFPSLAPVVAAAGREGERSEPKRSAAAMTGAAPPDKEMI